MPRQYPHYYAVRYKSVPNQIRIEQALTPEKAFRKAFGLPPILAKGAESNAEYKDLGTRVAVVQSDNKRVALLKDPHNWITFSHETKKFNDN